MYKLILLIAALSVLPAQVFGDEGPAQPAAGAATAGRREVRDEIRELRSAVRSPRRAEALGGVTAAKLLREDRDRSERRSEHRERAALRR